MLVGWRDGFLSRFLCCFESHAVLNLCLVQLSHMGTIELLCGINRQSSKWWMLVEKPKRFLDEFEVWSAWWGAGSKHSKWLPLSHFWEMERHPSMTSSFLLLCLRFPLLIQCNGHAERQDKLLHLKRWTASTERPYPFLSWTLHQWISELSSR